MLLVASCVFYMFFIPSYILILFFLIVIDYFAGLAIEKTAPKNKKLFLIISLVANLGVLSVFKYYNFFVGNIEGLASMLGFHTDIPLLNMILPIGLSFHTFQAMSYTIEVYRGKQKAEKNILLYTLYVMFYPQLVAGPIERPQNLLHQFREEHTFDYDRIVAGLKLMLWGLFKKVVIADRCGAYVSNVFDYPYQHEGETITFWCGLFFFAWQLYCDFSGYSDMAIGAAQVMGIKLMTNFKRPYLSKSIGEIWQRWHISLTSWFMDYIFRPLGGYRKGRDRGAINLLIVYFLSGLWHGAAWTFVFCFFIFGAQLVFRLYFKKQINWVFDKLESKKSKRWNNILHTAVAFITICIPFSFFRAHSLPDALFILKSLFNFGTGSLSIGNSSTFIYAVIGVVILYMVEIYQEYHSKSDLLPEPKSKILKYTFYSSVIVYILLTGVFDASQFIYFQF
ncbi:MAG: MBOAT family O-acyltransferase [Bacteroidota bacterium]